MFQLTDSESSKLAHLSGDKTLIEGLRKLFLNEFLSEKVRDNVEVIAASRLAIDYLQSGFRVLENLKEKPKEMPEIRNIV
jgi:hypothetical protein